MAINYNLNKPYALKNDKPSLTEPEHKESCDINVMLRRVHNGQQVRVSRNQPQYGHDDTTIDGLSHRINKQNLEQDLQQTFNSHEFSPEEADALPGQVKQRFKIKIKKSATNDDSNDDKGQKIDQNSEPAKTPTQKS